MILQLRSGLDAQDVGHFEFRSPHEPPRRIPLSETGYRSPCPPDGDRDLLDSPQDYARDFVLSSNSITSLECENQDRNQLPLF